MGNRALRRIVLAALAALVVAGAWVGVQHWREAEAPAPPGNADAAPAGPDAITALGRLQPQHGVRRIAGPSKPSVVVAKLEIEQGDRVTEGQTIAVLDAYEAAAAKVARWQAELDNALAEERRTDELFRDGIASVSTRDAWHMKAGVAHASLAQAKADLDLAVVRAPFAGQVLEIYTRAGEKVGADGIAELAMTNAMYTIAEVYETDIQRVRVGQRATMTSAALHTALHGSVELIHRKVGKRDVLNVDPAARTDARVVEVEIRLDPGQDEAMGLTNLEVDVAIEP